MWNLVRNELLKFIRSKKFLIFLFALLCVMLYGGISVYQDANNMRPEKQIERNQTLLTGLMDQILQEKSEEKKLELQEQRNRIKQENALLEKKLAGVDWDWKKEIKQKKSLFQQQIKDPAMKDTIRKEELRGKIAYYEYLLAHNIKPEEPYELSAFDDMIKFIPFITMILLPIVIAFPASDMMAGEYTTSTVKLLVTKPVSRGKIITSKFITLLLLTGGLVVLLEGLAFLWLGIKFSFGNPHMVTEVGTAYVRQKGHLSAVLGSTYLLPMWKVLLMTFGLQMLFVLSCVGFTFLISTLCYSNATSLTISFIVVALALVMTHFMPFPFMNKLYPFLFTSYSSGVEIIQGSACMKLGSSFTTVPMGIMAMLAWSVGSFGATYITFTKRDILI